MKLRINHHQQKNQIPVGLGISSDLKKELSDSFDKVQIIGEGIDYLTAKISDFIKFMSINKSDVLIEKEVIYIKNMIKSERRLR